MTYVVTFTGKNDLSISMHASVFYSLVLIMDRM